MYKYVDIQGGHFGTRRFNNKGVQTEFNPLGRAVYLQGIVKAWDINDYRMDVRFLYLNEWITLTIPRLDLNDKSLLKYTAHGMDVFSYNVQVLMKTLQNQEEIISPENVFYEHHGLGWSNYDGHEVFRGYEIDKDFLFSEYRGNFNIEPRGSLDVWLGMVKRLVVGNTPMEFALAVGFSSVLVKPLADKIDHESIFVHLIGASSTGKTTAANLIASIAGSPDVHSDGLMRTWNTTENAAVRALVGNNGFPIIFDEVSMQKKKDLSSFTYIVASGCEKRRMNDKKDVQVPRKFQTTVVSTGESSILNQTNGNAGLRMRLIEVGHIPFTPSAKVAEVVKKTCASNYGWAITPFANYVSSLNDDYLQKGWQHYYTKLMKTLVSDDKYAARLSKKLAVILLAAHIANKKFEIGLNMDNLIGFIANIAKSEFSENPVDIVENAYENLVQFIEMNKSQFSGVNECSNISTWGKFSKKNLPDYVDYQVFIPSTKFISILKQNLGFEDFSVIQQGFKERGFIETDKDHFTRKRKITSNGTAVRCYVINVFKDDSPDDDGELPE